MNERDIQIVHDVNVRNLARKVIYSTKFGNDEVDGVRLHNGEDIMFLHYPKHLPVRKVATTIAFHQGGPWYIHIPLARECIKVLGGVS